jgi:hypothetical protein
MIVGGAERFAKARAECGQLIGKVGKHERSAVSAERS